MELMIILRKELVHFSDGSGVSGNGVASTGKYFVMIILLLKELVVMKYLVQYQALHSCKTSSS